jgi:hypothetical protein
VGAVYKTSFILINLLIFAKKEFVEETFIKHLEFVQNIINRMSNNSFLLKGWNVTVSTAILSLMVGVANPLFVVIALFSSLSLWGLDAYYLRQERLYRLLYEDLQRNIIQKKTKAIELFSLSTKKYDSETPSWVRTLWSKSVFGLHGVVVAVIILAVALLLLLPS